MLEKAFPFSIPAALHDSYLHLFYCFVYIRETVFKRVCVKAMTRERALFGGKHLANVDPFVTTRVDMKKSVFNSKQYPEYG